MGDAAFSADAGFRRICSASLHQPEEGAAGRAHSYADEEDIISPDVQPRRRRPRAAGADLLLPMPPMRFTMKSTGALKMLAIPDILAKDFTLAFLFTPRRIKMSILKRQ